MIAAEQSKRSKKRDDGKIADWESQIEDYRDKIEELRQGIIDELSTTDLYSFPMIWLRVLSTDYVMVLITAKKLYKKR